MHLCSYGFGIGGNGYLKIFPLEYSRYFLTDILSLYSSIIFHNSVMPSLFTEHYLITYMHTHVYTVRCMHTYIMQLHIYIHMHTYIHTHVHMHTHMHAHTYVYTHMYTHTHTHNTVTHIHKHTYACIHTYTYIHTNVHTFSSSPAAGGNSNTKMPSISYHIKHCYLMSCYQSFTAKKMDIHTQTHTHTNFLDKKAILRNHNYVNQPTASTRLV